MSTQNLLVNTSRLLLVSGVLVPWLVLTQWGVALAQQPMTLQSSDGSFSASFSDIDRGMFCKSFTIRLGDETVEYKGFQYKIPGNKAKLKTAVWTQEPTRLSVRHELSDGSAILSELWLEDAAPALRCRFSSLNNVAEIGVGGLCSPVRRLYADTGWVVERPTRPHTRRRIMTDFIVAERDDGWFELQACDMSGGYRLDPDDNRCSLFSLYRVPEVTVTILVGREGVSDLVRRYRGLTTVSAPATAGKLAHRFLLDDWTGVHTRNTIQQIERLSYYGCRRFVLLFHNWQHFGYDVKLPDIFPAHKRVGGTEGLRALAEHCLDRDIPFGLHDNYSDIYPDAPSFQPDYAALLPKEWRREEKYHRGWFNRATGVRAYGWATDAAAAIAQRNFDLIRKALPITAYFLDVTSYGDPKAFEHPDGAFHSPLDDLRYGRTLYELARSSFGGAPVVGEGCTQKYLGAVDAAGCDLWSADRWGVDPGATDWEYYPLFNLAFHPDVILYGVGYPSRYKLPEPDYTADLYSEQALDDYRSSRILFGNSGFWQTTPISLNMDDARIVKEYYLSVPLAEQIERAAMVSATMDGDDLHRLRVQYANGTSVWVNRGFRPWSIDEYVLPQYGVMVKGEDFFQATLSMRNSRVDMVDTGSLLFLDGRGRQCMYRGVVTDGALVVEQNADSVVIRPIDRARLVRMNFRRFIPGRDFRGAKVSVMGWKNEKIDEFVIDKSTLVLDETTPLRTVTHDAPAGKRRPLAYYPYYIVTPR